MPVARVLLSLSLSRKGAAALAELFYGHDGHSSTGKGSESDGGDAEPAVLSPFPGRDEAAFFQHMYLPGQSRVDIAAFPRNICQHFAQVLKWHHDARKQGMNVPNMCCSGDMGNLPSKLVMSSICTGSGAGEVCAEAATQAFSMVFGQGMDVTVPFMAENVKFKRDHLLQNFVNQASKTCVFDDAVKLTQGAGTCHRHQSSSTEEARTCGMLSNYSEIAASAGSAGEILYGFSAGFSCKGFSLANNNFSKIKMLSMSPI